METRTDVWVSLCVAHRAEIFGYSRLLVAFQVLIAAKSLVTSGVITLAHGSTNNVDASAIISLVTTDFARRSNLCTL